MDAVGGAGGKQLRPRRRVGFSRTPYDRPLVGRHAPTELRISNGNGGGSWFSKFLSPIANGAGRLLSSVFRRQESAETSSSYSSSTDDEDENSSEEEQEDNARVVAAVENCNVTESRKQSGYPASVTNEKSVSKFFEIEQVLAGKTFTRDEFIHLTELLQSRIVDSSGSKVYGGTASTEQLHETYLRHAALEEAQRWSEERRKEREESGNGVWDSGLCGNVSRIALSSDEASSSPADIAKAYMGTQHTWSSSPLSLQSHLSRDEVIQSRLKSLLVPRTTECWSDAYRTPTPPRMSNRMQSLACTPYAMADHLQTPYYRAAYTQNSLQMLKRRSYMIDDSWASAATIRRIRQKSFGNVPSFSTPFTGFNSSMTDVGSSIPFSSSNREAGQNTFDKKTIETDGSNTVVPPSQVREDAHEVCTVPSHSSLTAQKILEHIDGKLPPPKENSSEEPLTFVRDKPSSQPTLDLINCDSDVQKKYKDNGNTPLSTSAAISLERPSSSVKGSKDFQSSGPNANKADLADASVFEKRKDQGLENEVHGSKNNTTPPDVQTSKSVSSALDVNLQCSANPTVKFGPGNTSTGPVLSCTTSTTKNLDTSKPNFDFKFDSKPEMLFSSAVEAAVAFASNSQSTSGSNHSSISPSNSAGSIDRVGSNSAMASQPVSRFMFSTPLFAGSSVRSTSPSVFGTPFTSASGASFGFGKPCAFGSAPAPSFNLVNSEALAFGSASKTSFGSTTNASFGMKTAQSSSNDYSFGAGANFGFSTMAANSGFASTPTFLFGSGTSSVHSSSTSFSLNSVTPLKSSSTSFGTCPQFGLGISSNGVANQTSNFKEHVEVSAAKPFTGTITSVKWNLGDTSLPSTGFASSCGTHKTMSLSTNITSASGTMPVVTIDDAINHSKMTGKDTVEDAATSSSPAPPVFVQESSLMASPTSVTLAVDSQSNTQSTGAQPGSPSQNPSVSDAQTAIASVGHNESTVGSFPGISSQKQSRKITRPKREKTRKK